MKKNKKTTVKATAVILSVVGVIVGIIIIIVNWTGYSFISEREKDEDPVQMLTDATEILQKGFINKEAISNIGDPYIVEEDGIYYITATGEGRYYDIYSSPDLVNWDKTGKIFESNPNKGWVRGSLWQPQIVPGDDGKYYLYYCGTNDFGSLRIGVASADSITGPYVDALDHPLMELGYATIDPYFYTDDDGKMYLYYSRDCSENIVDMIHTSQLYCVEMGDYTHLKEGTKPVLLLSPNQEWELVTGDYRWNEGPHVLKKDGTYYLFYSGGCYADKTYSMGYATSASPMGPFEKYEHNPIIASTDDVSGPGNNSFFVTRDGKELYNCYHTHTIKIIGGGNRKVNFDRCGYRADGTFYMNGPTTTYQAPISGFGDLDKVDNYSEYAYIIKNDGKYISKSALDLASDMGKPEAGEYLMERLLSLTDGETLNSKNEEMYEWSVYSDTNGSGSDLNGEKIPTAAGFKISFDATETISCIYLYGTNRQNFVPEQIEIIFDNNKKLGTDDLCINVPAGQTEPVVLSFESVDTASVTVAVKDFGSADGFALSDIAFYRKK